MWPARRSPTGTSEQALASLGRAIWSWERPAESQLAEACACATPCYPHTNPNSLTLTLTRLVHSECRAQLLDCGGIALLLSTASSAGDEVRAACARALANLSFDAAYSGRIIEAGG